MIDSMATDRTLSKNNINEEKNQYRKCKNKLKLTLKSKDA